MRRHSVVESQDHDPRENCADHRDGVSSVTRIGVAARERGRKAHAMKVVRFT